jgi:hypothetical protein
LLVSHIDDELSGLLLVQRFRTDREKASRDQIARLFLVIAGIEQVAGNLLLHEIIVARQLSAISRSRHVGMSPV